MQGDILTEGRAGREHGASHRVTIVDVAQRAGVAISTVSRAVNGRAGVSPNTLKRVQAAIDDLGYEPSFVARSLRSERTNVIGVLAADIVPFSAEVLKGVAEAMSSTPFELVVYCGGSAVKPGWEQAYMSRLSGTLTDATILITPSVAEVASPNPVVGIDPYSAAADFPSVTVQHREGGALATQHLIDLGHRRIGLISGPAGTVPADERAEGFREAMNTAGYAIDPCLVVEGGFRRSSALDVIRQILTLPERPTAIVAANDLVALDVLRVAAEIGLSIPDDVSVVGFDNIPESALATPPLTTISQPLHQLGIRAVNLAVETLEREAPATAPERITLPTSLVVRSSTAPPPDRPRDD